MNIYVCMKQVPDTETKIKLNNTETQIDTTGINWILSPYDILAIEEALRLKEKTPNSTVTLISAGPTRVIEAIRSGLAMGADSGVHIEIPETLDSYGTAKALATALKKESSIDIIFTGKEAIDDSASQVSQLLAEFLGLPCISVVLKIEYNGQNVRCKREIEGGAFEILEAPLPVVIATQKGLNEPRYAILPNIVKAKKKEIKTIRLTDLNLSESHQKIRYKNYKLPPPKPPGKKLAGTPHEQAKELARLLHEEAKVI